MATLTVRDSRRLGRSGASGRAVRLLWWVLAFLLLAVVVGFSWDRAWHVTNPFEDFWSPPHLFIYTTLAVAAGILARLVRDPAIRECFGRNEVAIPVAGSLPAPLFLPVAGLATVLLAGVFDSVWHNTFGLDETGWSFPHGMIGWGLLLTLLGFWSARLSLTGERPLGWLGHALLTLLVVTSASGVVLGPLGNNNTPDLVREIAAIPVLAAEPEAQHTFRIYLDWNITRTAPLFVPLAAFAAATGLTLGRRLLRNSWGLLAVVSVATLFAISGELRTARYFGIEDDPQNWLPVPLLPMLVAVLLSERLRAPDYLAWLIGGFTLGIFATAWWGAPGELALAAAPAALLGRWAALRVAGVVSSPTPRSAWTLALTLGLLVPACLGAIDLYLRATTA